LRRAIAVDKQTFEDRFPVGKHLLWAITTVAKSFALQDESFRWGGPTDVIDERQFEAVRHFADLAMIRITGAHTHLVTTGNTMQPDDSVHRFPIHVSMWATKAIIAEAVKFKRTTRAVIQQAAKFSSNPNDEKENKNRYSQATKDGWFLRDSSFIIWSLQQHFFLEKHAIAFEVEEVRRVFGSSLDIILPNCPLVVSWSEAVSPSLWPLAMMEVSNTPRIRYPDSYCLIWWIM